MTSRSLVDLGRALRELRLAAGLTQEQVASRIGLDGAYVSRVERGVRDLQFSTLGRFLDAVGADFADLEQAIRGK
jgi:transcriptional regulator with XRE-family HTH domain